MTMVVFLLEEPSAEALIRGLLPKLFPEEGTIEARFVVFEGKQDLEKKMERRIRGWLHPASFVVLRDQDAGDCRVVKQGLAARAAAGGRADALIRVACKELEAWVLGDWPAIAAEFNTPSVAALGRKEKFRNPDLLVRPVEEIQRHVPDYRKVEGARRMGPRLDPAANTSPSFRAFCDGLRRLIAAPLPHPTRPTGRRV